MRPDLWHPEGPESAKYLLFKSQALAQHSKSPVCPEQQSLCTAPIPWPCLGAVWLGTNSSHASPGMLCAWGFGSQQPCEDVHAGTHPLGPSRRKLAPSTAPLQPPNHTPISPFLTRALRKLATLEQVSWNSLGRRNEVLLNSSFHTRANSSVGTNWELMTAITKPFIL